jgi:ribosomal protein S18 acetylase RimI-like enzyme
MLEGRKMPTQIERVRKIDNKTLAHLFDRANGGIAETNTHFFEDEENVFLVSRTDGNLSGFLWGYVLQSPNSSFPKMFLYSIDVFDEFRRQGIASKLIEELKRIAREHRCREMFVPTQKSNGAAMGLYSKTKGRVANEDDVLFIYDEDALT